MSLWSPAWLTWHRSRSGKKPAPSQPRHQQCLIFACFLCLFSASCPYPGLTTQFAVCILQCQMKRRTLFRLLPQNTTNRVPYKQETFIYSSCGGWEALGQGASMVGCVFTRRKGLGSAVRLPLFYFILFYWGVKQQKFILTILKARKLKSRCGQVGFLVEALRDNSSHALWGLF